ncbi:MAG: DUF1223 domain-containing protein [Pyrinomonadaceae bacterium]
MLILTGGNLSFQISAKTPVLVELFTSQGCPTCPAADKVLAELETAQPVSDAEIITLAWHVDYWDSFGWKDEFSSPIFSQRQVAYSRALNFSGTYTPQMFVDGTTYFIGTKMDKATKAISQSVKNSKPEIKVFYDAEKLKINIPNLPKHERSTVYIAFSQDNLTRKIGRGNNAGKTLTHSSVARDLRAVASIDPQTQKFDSETILQMQPEWSRENLHLIVFVQENGSRRIFAVTRFDIPS